MTGALLVALACGCAAEETAAPELLSSLGLMRFENGDVVYSAGVLPYELNTPLFSDYAVKRRAIALPPGGAMTYSADAPFDFPVGTRILKSFLFPPDLRAPTSGLQILETRVLEKTSAGWEAKPYIWRADGSDAELQNGGEVRAVSFIDPQGVSRSASYLIPQKNQCLACHEQKDSTGSRYLALLGPKARHLNRLADDGSGVANQLERWEAQGALSGLPGDLSTVPRAFAESDWLGVEPTSLPPADLDAAARDYLDVNCAHCHNPRAVQGVTSQLFLNHDNTNSFNLGVCKRPGSAGLGTGGHEFDIVPGDPDASILYFRTASEEVGAMMPLLGRSVAHHEGVLLLRAWIAAMPADDCQ